MYGTDTTADLDTFASYFTLYLSAEAFCQVGISIFKIDISLFDTHRSLISPSNIDSLKRSIQPKLKSNGSIVIDFRKKKNTVTNFKYRAYKVVEMLQK